jgi:hypothetical protein
MSDHMVERPSIGSSMEVMVGDWITQHFFPR